MRIGLADVQKWCCIWCSNLFRLSVNSKFTERFHSPMLWHFTLCLTDVSVRFYSLTVTLPMQLIFVCGFFMSLIFRSTHLIFLYTVGLSFDWFLLISSSLFFFFFLENPNITCWFLLRPPRSGLLMPGVFKPSCSTPFTLFLHLVSIYQSFQFHSKNSLHDTAIFSSLLTTYFYLTGHSPVSIYNTPLLYILLALCSHLQTQRFAVRCIPCRERMGSWWPGLPLDGALP